MYTTFYIVGDAGKYLIWFEYAKTTTKSFWNKFLLHRCQQPFNWKLFQIILNHFSWMPHIAQEYLQFSLAVCLNELLVHIPACCRSIKWRMDAGKTLHDMFGCTTSNGNSRNSFFLWCDDDVLRMPFWRLLKIHNAKTRVNNQIRVSSKMKNVQWCYRSYLPHTPYAWIGNTSENQLNQMESFSLLFIAFQHLECAQNSIKFHW